MSPSAHSRANAVLCGILSHVCWGILPLFWKLVASVPSSEVLAHRVVWSALFLLAVLSMRRESDQFFASLRDIKVVGVFLLSSLLLAFNWYTFIWAIAQGRVLECSLGYFICPLVSLLLGVLFLGDRPRGLQYPALLLVIGAVTYLTYSYGHFPWIALSLAISFALYGLVRKLAPRDSLMGLTLESTFLAPIACGYLYFLFQQDTLAFFHQSRSMDLLLLLCGVVTTIPLLLYASAVKRLEFSTMGMYQYIGPTLQFLLAVFYFQEPARFEKLIAFPIIWVALVLYVAEGFRKR